MAGAMAVIGAGTMGIGVTYVFLAAGWDTTVVEPDEARAGGLRRQLADVAADGERRGRLSGELASGLADRLTIVTDVTEVPSGLDLVIESVPEREDLKRRVLETAERTAPKMLATNTSSLSIDGLAGSLRRPECFLGMHFFNPVWSLRLVEVVRGTRTDDDVVGRAVGIVGEIGKEAAVVTDSPGFATSRLDLIAALEAMRMVEAGVAGAEDIDRAIRLAYRHPVGPLRLSDIVGLDVRLDIARQLSSSLGDRFAPPGILEDMVARGELGEKTGRGFYEWPRDDG